MRFALLRGTLQITALSAPVAVKAEPRETEHLIPFSMGNVYGVLKMPAAQTPVPRAVSPPSAWISAEAVYTARNPDD